MHALLNTSNSSSELIDGRNVKMLFFLPCCHCRFPLPLSLPRIQKKNPRSEKAGEGNKPPPPPPPPPLLPQWLRLEKRGGELEEEEEEEPCMKRKREEGAYMDGEGSAFLLLPVPLFPRRYFAYSSCISLTARSHSSQAKGIAAPKIIILLFTTGPGAYILLLKRGISRNIISPFYAGLFCCLYTGIELMQFLLSRPTLTCIFLPVFLSALIFAAKRSW